jgi:multidrug resistance efflux pump
MKKINDSLDKYQSEELKEISLASNVSDFKKVLYFIISFILISIIISAVIKYPEKIIGRAFIVSKNHTNNIYAPTSGEIVLLVKDNAYVQKGTLLALIKSTTDYSDLMKLKNQLEKIDINKIESSIDIEFDKTLKLGEIEKFYYNFLLAIIECDNTFKIDQVGQRINNIENKLYRNTERGKILQKAKKVFADKSDIVNKSYEMDLSLFDAEAIVRDKIDNSKLTVLDMKEKAILIDKNDQDLTHNTGELSDEILLLKKDQEKLIASALFNVKKAFFELKTAIDHWEYNFAITAPISGIVEYYQPFLNSSQFVKKESSLFIILPKVENVYARGVMSANGYGKMRNNDTVYIKLRDFPFKEYGDLKGIIYNKSKVYHDTIYYIDIKLDPALKTTHNKKIDFSYNMPGTVEYYGKKRSLLQRIFRNVQNSIEK